MNTVNTVAQRVAELLAEGKEKRIIEATLTLEGYRPKDIKAATKELAQAKTNFAALFYDWLATECRTEEECEAYIMGEGEFGETSANTQAHLSHYMNIARMSIAIWEAK